MELQEQQPQAVVRVNEPNQSVGTAATSTIAAAATAETSVATQSQIVGVVEKKSSETPEMRTVNAANTNTKKSTTTSKGNKQHVKKLHSNKNTVNKKLKQTNKNTATNSKNSAEHLQKAEGSLSGLSSLKRVGNVKVVADPEGRNSTIKAKFTLGPLILRVEKSFKRGSVTNVRSATARTNEMIGRIKFSVVNDRATLMSIKVQQPKQVSWIIEIFSFFLYI